MNPAGALGALGALVMSHFTAVILFALFASVVFAITLREKRREQWRYGAFCFACFVVGTIIAGWILYFLQPR
ncbi:MAG: hypothetical protein ACRD13_02030 [Terriglobales bacterium]